MSSQTIRFLNDVCPHDTFTGMSVNKLEYLIKLFKVLEVMSHNDKVHGLDFIAVKIRISTLHIQWSVHIDLSGCQGLIEPQPHNQYKMIPDGPTTLVFVSHK